MTGEQDFDGKAGQNHPLPADTGAALAELAVRLRGQAASLREDILRLRRALSDIDAAMSVSLDRLNDARHSNAVLQTMLEPPGSAGAPAGDEPAAPQDAADASGRPHLVIEKRSSGDRRSGVDRRRDPSEVTGLLRWLEGSSLDRRSGTDRRSGQDRRMAKPVKTPIQRSRQTKTDKVRPAATVISIAEVRATRRPPKAGD